MKNLQKFCVIWCAAYFCMHGDLNAVLRLNLGLSSFLDGGPLRPQAGWYWSEVVTYYTASRFFDGFGNLLPQSPELDSASIITQFIYQGKREVFNARPGIAGGLSVSPYLSLTDNPYVRAGGKGLGDLGLGIFLQFKPIIRNGRPLLVQRLEIDASFPTGKFVPNTLINPSNGVFYVNPYWAATLFFTPHWAVSWRLNYNWSSFNKKNGIQFGDLIYANYTMEFEVIDRLWMGMNGYALKELKNRTLNGVPIPNSRRRIVGVGPGLLYRPRDGVNLFANLYFESKARARAAGTSAVFRLLYQF